MSAAKLINAAETCVQDAVQGALLTDSRLRRIGDLNILVRSDINQIRDQQVTIVSGGGSGHEPAHAGFIGEGMISCAVLGNVFASPSVSSILAAIRTVAGQKGVLLVVKNYTGDRLNFGMALELAKKDGIDVMMVIVADDCALPLDKGITGGRGIAGTVFVHKIAGAAASAGSSLPEVHAAASAAATRLGSMGVALTTCTLPGAAPSESRLADPELIEVGMGIHGESGREVMKLPSNNSSSSSDGAGVGTAQYVAGLLVEGILGSAAGSATAASGSGEPLPARLQHQAGQRVAVLLNNLGTVPVLEMLIVAKEVMQQLRSRGLVPVRAFVGPYMTSLDMCGVSLSLLLIDGDGAADKLLQQVDHPTTAPAWVKSSELIRDADNTNRSLPIPAASNSTGDTAAAGLRCEDHVLHVIKEICLRLIELEPMLTKFDAKCGDGDCGLVLKKGAEKVITEITRIKADSQMQEGHGGELSAVSLFSVLADAVSASMGGTSGALLELCFRAMASHFSHAPALPPPPPGTEPAAAATATAESAELASAADWVAALAAGVGAIQFYGGAARGMRTMLDAFIPALEALQKGGSIQDAAVAASTGMHATKSMVGLAGRSNYVSADTMKGIPDPGAAAVSAAFSVMSDELR